MGGPQQQPVVRAEQREQRHLRRRGQLVPELLGVAGEVEAQHGQHAAHGVDVGRDGRAFGGDLRRAVAAGEEDRAGRVVDVPDGAEVDQLDLGVGLDHVVRLEIAVEQADAVQISHGGQHFQAVGQHAGQWQRRNPAVGVLVGQRDLAQRLAADVLHHDVADLVAGGRIVVLNEVVDLDDVGVLDLGQELLLGHRRRHRGRVAGVDQSFEDHPAVVHVVVAGQVDPA